MMNSLKAPTCLGLIAAIALVLPATVSAQQSLEDKLMLHLEDCEAGVPSRGKVMFLHHIEKVKARVKKWAAKYEQAKSARLQFNKSCEAYNGNQLGNNVTTLGVSGVSAASLGSNVSNDTPEEDVNGLKTNIEEISAMSEQKLLEEKSKTNRIGSPHEEMVLFKKMCVPKLAKLNQDVSNKVAELRTIKQCQIGTAKK